MDSNSSEGRDRLGELPNSLILSSILSLLETRDAVTTTFISKRWNNLWTTVPCLQFRDEKLGFIHAAIARWKGAKVTKFTILFHNSDDYRCYVCPSTDIDSCLYFAIATQSEELHMDLGNWRSDTHRNDDDEHSPPQLLYSCSSFTKLTLSYFNLKIEGNVQWSRLKSLTIDSEGLLGEEHLSKIISGAPLLEELNLCVYEISENFSIRSRSLKKLRMDRPCWDYSMPARKVVLRIWAPNLLILDISDFFHCCCCLDVPSLVHAKFHDFLIKGTNYGVSASYKMFYQLFRSICHVEKLLVKMKKNGMGVRFSKAEFLYLDNVVGDKMVDVLEMFPKLMAMGVVNNESRDASGSTLQTETTFPNPSLLQLKRVDIFIWHTRLESIFLDVKILLANAHMLEKMVFRLSRSRTCIPNTLILAEAIQEKVMSMLKASPTAEVFVIEDW